jgi:tRNA (guanine37-N1)-methyltransferase
MATTNPIQTDRKEAPNNADGNIEFFAASDFPVMSWFDETVEHPALSVPVRLVAQFKKQLKRFILQGQRNVYIPSDVAISESSARRIVVFNVGVTREEILTYTSINGPLACDSGDENCEEDVKWINSFPITRGYNDMSVDEVLRKLLPKDSVTEIPSGFELVGQLAHMNLRDCCLPYKFWIGRVLLDKNQPTIRTVVNKIGTIESENVFRTFQQEVLAGYSEEPDWSVTTVHEHGCIFQMDFRHVYWNSRLSGEHQRIVQIIRKSFEAKYKANTSDSDTAFVVADLMAGIGPFAIPLTSAILKSNAHLVDSGFQSELDFLPCKSKIVVYANDLNPVSFKYLQLNSTKNKCSNLLCSNEDARLFLRRLQLQGTAIDHVIMNLPAKAPEFLDAFRGWSLMSLPIIHLHCFGDKSTSQHSAHNQNVIDHCIKCLGCSIEGANIVNVRNVSPNKNMYCVSFRLPQKTRELPPIFSTLEMPSVNAKELNSAKLKRAKLR